MDIKFSENVVLSDLTLKQGTDKLCCNFRCAVGDIKLATQVMKGTPAYGNPVVEATGMSGVTAAIVTAFPIVFYNTDDLRIKATAIIMGLGTTFVLSGVSLGLINNVRKIGTYAREFGRVTDDALIVPRIVQFSDGELHLSGLGEIKERDLSSVPLLSGPT